MLYYFFLIAGVADDYFSPTMANISEVLKLPHNFAGVTFLAFGKCKTHKYIRNAFAVFQNTKK